VKSVSKNYSTTHAVLRNITQDVFGSIALIYWGIEKILELDENQEAAKWIIIRLRSMNMFRDAKDLDINDIRRLGCLNPATITTLFDQRQYTTIAKYVPLAEDFICIKRSMASRILRDDSGSSCIDIRSIILSSVFQSNLLSERQSSRACSNSCTTRQPCKRLTGRSYRGLPTNTS
jgi:hypothetical protein